MFVNTVFGTYNSERQEESEHEHPLKHEEQTTNHVHHQHKNHTEVTNQTFVDKPLHLMGF